MKGTYKSILLIIAISINTPLFSQEADLNKTIHLTEKNVTIQEIINLLNNVEGIYVSHNLDQNVVHKNVHINESNPAIQNILSIIAGYGIEYKIINNHIILKTKEIKQKYSISGIVTSKKDGESLIGANVYTKKDFIGTTTNEYGFYSLTLDEGVYNIVYSFIGMEKKEMELVLNKDLKIDVSLGEKSNELDEVVIYSTQKKEQLLNPYSGHVKISSKSIESIPALMGEPDIIRTIKLMPGVQPASETSSGLSIRGGGRDQNLVLLDEANVYNPGHLMGIFSVFNNDAIKNVEFYKCNIPARYGGRLASTMDVRMNDGNSENLSVKGGISLISSKLTIESPLFKKKSSFLISARRTYVDLFLPLSSDEDIQKTDLYFYDLNVKTNFILNENNRLYFSGYFGRDVFKYSGDSFNPKTNWGNSTFTIRWNHIYNHKLFSNLSIIGNEYNFLGVTSNWVGELKNASGSWNASIREVSAKFDYSYYVTPEFTTAFGLHSTLHEYKPGTAKIEYDDYSNSIEIPHKNTLDNSLYMNLKYDFNNKLIFSLGLRYTLFHNMGAATEYKYDSEYNPIDTIDYSTNDIYNTYDELNPRLSLVYLLSGNNSIKMAYARTSQFAQIASNSNTGTPVDAWIPSGPNLKPQISNQFSLGYFHNFFDNDIEASVEGYYKDLQNQLDYKDQADLILNKHIESQLREGNGRAYGLEVMVKKNNNNLTGWVSYTLSKSERMIDGINNNQVYLSPYDRPHNLSVYLNYKLSKRISLSGTFVYYSGAPFTSPTGRYTYDGTILPVYSERNGDRMPAYHRMDLSVTLHSKATKRFRSEWSLSVYNAYNRKNPTMIYFTNDFLEREKTSAKMIYVLPILPTISYNFNF